MCGERSFVRATMLCNDTIKINIRTATAVDTTAISPKKSAIVASFKKSMPKGAKKSVTFASDTSEAPLLIKVANPKPSVPNAPETKEYNKPMVSRNLVAGDHVCYRDAGSIYCLICQMPMFFVFANNLEYPRGFPTLLLDKVKLLEKTLTEAAYAKIVDSLNGGPIPGASAHALFTSDIFLTNFENYDSPMKIEITIVSSDTAYSGPSKNALSEIFTVAIIRKRTIIIPIMIANSDINDQLNMFIAIYPNGNVYCVDPTLGVSESQCVENLLTFVFSGIKNKINKNELGFITHRFWNKTCIQQSKTYIDFTESPLWKPVMMLVLMSLLSIRMPIKDAVAFLVCQDKETMSLLIDPVIERIIAIIAEFAQCAGSTPP